MGEVLAFPPELLTKKHVAYMLSTSETGVKDLVRAGHLTPVDDGGKYTKFRLSDVRYYIEHLPEADVADRAEVGAAGRAAAQAAGAR